MNGTRWPWIAARLAVTGYCLITAAYAVITSSTFAYLQFIQPRVLPWLGTLADWHAALSWPVLGLAIAVVLPDVRRAGPARAPAAAFMATMSLAVAWMTIQPLLPALADDAFSLRVAVLALCPPIWLAGLDHVRHRDVFTGEPTPSMSNGDSDRHDARLLAACAVTAGTVTAAFLLLAFAKRATTFEPDLLGTAFAYAAWRSLLSHAVAFGGLYLVLSLWGRAAGRTAWRVHVAWLLLFVAAVGAAFDAAVGNVLNLIGPIRWVLGIAVGLALVGTWSGMGLTVAASMTPSPRGLDIFFGRSESQGAGRVLLRAFLLAVVLAWSTDAVSTVADWDRLLQRVGVGVVWLAVFAWSYRTAPAWRRYPASAAVAACLVPLVSLSYSGPSEDDRRSLTRYGIYDPSFWVIDQTLRPRPSAPAFDQYLRANTGLNDVQLPAVDIDFVDHLEAKPSVPHVFLFVVDSLRPDYLSPYNRAVGFTPGIERFAADSLVFTNAFTHYGGTGLSMPAIWAGSTLPHKQYVTPFAPMNALEKLLDANRYVRVQSFDNVMHPLFRPSSIVHDVGRGSGPLDVELCRVLPDLERTVAGAPRGAALFGYSRPLDVHMSQLSRWAVPQGDFTGFFAPYAGRIQGLDRCFGQFIDELRRLGVYDDSLIILTADHGEMLGEHGQYGHSYHLFPEVVAVPLIVHLPKRMAPTLRANPASLALTTDITPTIYAVLGYHPKQLPLSGQPLVAVGGPPPARRRDVHVISASYGAVYAVLSRQGRRLYIANAVKGEDHMYERLTTAGWVERPVRPDERAVEQYAIRQHVDETAKIFHVPARQ